MGLYHHLQDQFFMLSPILTELRPNSAKNGSKSTIFGFHLKNAFLGGLLSPFPGVVHRAVRPDGWPAGLPAGWLAGQRVAFLAAGGLEMSLE